MSSGRFEDDVGVVLQLLQDLGNVEEAQHEHAESLRQNFYLAMVEEKKLAEGETPNIEARLSEQKDQTDAIFSELKRLNREQRRVIKRLQDAYCAAALHETKLEAEDSRGLSNEETKLPPHNDDSECEGSPPIRVYKRACRSKR